MSLTVTKGILALCVASGLTTLYDEPLLSEVAQKVFSNEITIRQSEAYCAPTGEDSVTVFNTESGAQMYVVNNLEPLPKMDVTFVNKNIQTGQANDGTDFTVIKNFLGEGNCKGHPKETGKPDVNYVLG